MDIEPTDDQERLRFTSLKFGELLAVVDEGGRGRGFIPCVFGQGNRERFASSSVSPYSCSPRYFRELNVDSHGTVRQGCEQVDLQ